MLKKYNQILTRVEKLLKIEFHCKFSSQKNAKRKSTMQVFINNNARFCYQSKKKVFSSNTFGRMLIWTKKDRNREPYWWWFRKKVCLINLDNEADNDSNDASSEYLLKAEKVF